MALRSKIQRNQPTNFKPAPKTGMFQSRPFAAPKSASSQTPEVQAKAKTQSQSNRLSYVDFSVPPTIQPKLTIGAPGDKYEQEADTVARKVVQQVNSSGSGASETVQRQSPTLSIQPKLSFPTRSIQRRKEEATPDLESSISRAKGGGSPLDNATRPKMESAFGADFGGVRVHTDASSDMLSRSISARAFTTGQHIFFKKGEYNPSSAGGQELLAHELTHVVQQAGNNSGAVMKSESHIQRFPTPEKSNKKNEEIKVNSQAEINLEKENLKEQHQEEMALLTQKKVLRESQPNFKALPPKEKELLEQEFKREQEDLKIKQKEENEQLEDKESINKNQPKSGNILPRNK
ncbi:DUF4157 domain-containing protein [Laspinema sp. A4]|uniref:eCIS core domain-containing protein n=1 Tax=Laspinema sp. D2d TaxID=2953686 RepID=UPI0021BA3E0C|nr:DUF4157 domain-containing protein [Laspinema sp. D2d]MCT7984923.1 DUF4157 domain-containing protein [Laspinema sp. D2d]